MSSSRRVSLCFKLIGSFTILLILTVLTGAIALTAIGGLGRTLDQAVNSSARKMDLSGEIHAGVGAMRNHAALAEISLLDMKIGGHAMGEVSGTECASCHTADHVVTKQQAFMTAARDITAKIADLRRLPVNHAELKALDDLEKGVGTWGSLYKSYLDLAQGHDFPAAHQIMVDSIYPLVAGIDKAADALIEEQRKDLAAARVQADHQASTALWRAASTVVLALIAAIVGLWVVRQVARTLRRRAAELREMSAQVAATAGELAQSNDSLAQGAIQQAESIRQTSAATEDIQSRTRLNVTGTQSAAEAMAVEARLSSQAHGKLDELLSSMQQMVAASGRISSIIRTIESVGPSPRRARAAASLVTRWTASRSLPSHTTPGMPYPTPRDARSSFANCSRTGVDSPY